MDIHNVPAAPKVVLLAWAHLISLKGIQKVVTSDQFNQGNRSRNKVHENSNLRIKQIKEYT